MDAQLSRAGIARKSDPHGWNTYDHYTTIHETQLAQHPFVDLSRQHTLEFTELEFAGVLFVRLAGRLHCKRDVVLEVEKLFETRQVRGRLRIRGIRYRYVAWVHNGQPILRYHNLHAFDPATGEQTLYETLTRQQFPVFTEVLDEVELVARRLEGS